MFSTWFFVYAIHVFSGVFWIGAAVLVTAFILPAVRAAGPSGGAVMGHLTGSAKLPLWISVAGALTTLSGLLLFWNGMPDDPAAHGLALEEAVFLAGCLMGVGAFLFGTLVQSPRAARLSRITAQLQGPPNGDQLLSIATLQRQLQVGGYIGVGLLIAALVGMVANHPI